MRKMMRILLLYAIFQMVVLHSVVAQQFSKGDVVQGYKDKAVTKRMAALKNNDVVKHIMREEKFASRELTPADTIPDNIPMTSRKQNLVRLSPEEIARQFPECVTTDHLDIKHVDYTSVISVLFEALTEQNETINRLQKRVEKLENK